MSGIYGKGIRARATKLHAEVVRARGRCERCGAAGIRLETAHIISRRYAATRCDPANAWCLCSGCHRRLTEHPDEHMRFVAETIGMVAFDALKAKALAGVKTNDTYWQAQLEALAALAGPEKESA